MKQQWDTLFQSEGGKADMIVFSHLRWDFVFQRPQQLITRLSKYRKILFVEEPIEYNKDNVGTANIYKAGKNITVLQPRIPWENFVDNLTLLVDRVTKKQGIKNPILWFYSAAFGSIIDNIEHSLVIYDCMDELSAFKGAPADLIRCERQLLSEADIVFTGGKSLYESKSKLHDNVYCFRSSVDKKFFSKSTSSEIKIPDDIKYLSHPQVGFYGVIDERLDTTLLDQIAKELPQVSFVMIGPVVKISEDELPKRPNIHYLGGKNYKVLPNYLKSFDITMMPFALNESTKFISPTKTLEYMAANKPIISTPIYDVVSDYSHVVKIASDIKQFKDAIISYLQETSYERKDREMLQKKILDNTSWDNTANKINKIINEALEENSDYVNTFPAILPANLLNQNVIWKKQK